MQRLTGIVLGATGLIGQQLVQQLLNDPAFSKIRILVRRPVELSHPKLEIALANFNDLQDYRDKLGQGDCIFCCIGTTNKKVKGDKAAYRKIDFDIAVDAARMGRAAGFNTYLLVSAVGADAKSVNFYTRLKGEVEIEISSLHYPVLHIFRPSILHGNRLEFRLGEKIGKGLMKGLSIFMVQGLTKYRGIDSLEVARAMVAAAKSAEQGTFFHHYNEMMGTGGTRK